MGYGIISGEPDDPDRGRTNNKAGEILRDQEHALSNVFNVPRPVP